MSIKLSNDFTLEEMTYSETAQRYPDLIKEQENPSQEIITNLTYLASNLQKARDGFQYPMTISSAYRCTRVNELVGGAPTSQHVKGEAVDVIINKAFLTDQRTFNFRKQINQKVMSLVNKPLKVVNANFYLFLHIILNLEAFQVDQVIHEYGTNGKPVWVHFSSSRKKLRHQILVIGKETISYSINQAILLGC